MPVPIRHYWIERYNKHQEKPGVAPTDRPLTQAERAKFVKNSQQTSNNPLPDISTIMSSRRNRK